VEKREILMVFENEGTMIRSTIAKPPNTRKELGLSKSKNKW